MFNALEVMGSLFTVTVQRKDGTLRDLTGRLIAPNYTGSKDDLTAYCASLEEKNLVPIYTDEGWRSFYQDKVISIRFGN